MKGTDLLDNAAIAELLAREAEQAQRSSSSGFLPRRSERLLVGTRNVRFAGGWETAD
jgi:hypothetical protein